MSKALPVLFGFFIMGFVDVVGIATNYVKKDFTLTDSVANLLPMMVFLWFFVLSIPTGLLMNKIGRKKTVVVSMVFTFVAMLIPLLAYTFTTMLVTFALLGMINWLYQWYSPNGPTKQNELAQLYTDFFFRGLLGTI